jgi:hypothetical protein
MLPKEIVVGSTTYIQEDNRPAYYNVNGRMAFEAIHASRFPQDVLDDAIKRGMVMENSAHVTDVVEEKLFTPSIDEQIELITAFISADNFAGTPHYRAKNPDVLKAIKENLMTLKLGMKLPGYLGKVDVAKVIEDLCQYVRDTQTHVPPCLSNGEAALGMLQAFKQERVVTAKDVVEAHHRGEDILPKYEVKVKFNKETIANELYFDIRNCGPHAEAVAIVNAIEKMIRLHGVK